MKTGILGHKVIDGKLVFEFKEKPKKKSFVNEINKNGEFTNSLKLMNLQRIIIRLSKEVDKFSLNKEFRI